MEIVWITGFVVAEMLTVWTDNDFNYMHLFSLLVVSNISAECPEYLHLDVWTWMAPGM